MSATPLVGNTFFGIDIAQLGAQLMSLRRRLSKRLLLLEFGASGLRYAEASISSEGIRFSHISRVPLPEEALERGVPSDPAMMATLIKAICQEKKIPAHRAAVVLSPEVAYQRVIELPSDLTADQAFAYVRDPANAIPLPFPLDQTDFDLYPLDKQHGVDLQSYLLIAVPQVLIDCVINLLSDAGLSAHLSWVHSVWRCDFFWIKLPVWVSQTCPCIGVFRLFAAVCGVFQRSHPPRALVCDSRFS